MRSWPSGQRQNAQRTQKIAPNTAEGYAGTQAIEIGNPCLPSFSTTYGLAPFRVRGRKRVRHSENLSTGGVVWTRAGKNGETPALLVRDARLIRSGGRNRVRFGVRGRGSKSKRGSRIREPRSGKLGEGATPTSLTPERGTLDSVHNGNGESDRIMREAADPIRFAN